MVFGIILFIIVLAIVGSLASTVILWLYRHLGQSDAKPIDWNAEVSYPQFFTPAVTIFLLGYHIGLYSYVFNFVSDMRFPATGWAIFSVFAAAFWLILLWNKRSALVLSAIIAIAGSGVMVALRSNGFVQSLNLVVQTISAIVLGLTLIRDHMDWTLSSIFHSILAVLPHSIIHTVQIARSLLRRDPNKKHPIGSWIKTFIITVGVLVVFIYILSQADPIFSQIIKEFRDQLFGRTVATIILLFIAAAFASIKLTGKTQTSGSWLTFRDIIFAVFAVVSIVLVFLFVQYKYLFLGSRDLLVELNLSFSEYVRKGFTELLLATFIGGFLSYITTLKVRDHADKNQSRWATLLNIFLIVELFFLLGSALKRDLLYVDTYGLTRVRVVGGLFLVWLFSFLVVLIAFSVKKTLRESRILTSMWILSLAVWLVLNVINIDKIVIDGAPKHHQYTDYFYLMQLSEDVTDKKTELLSNIQNETDTLLTKDSLTDVEKAQFAGIKLALITFIEKRDRLYRYYAPNSWLLQNGWRIGNQFEENMNSFSYDMVPDSISAKNWRNPEIKHTLDESLLKQKKFAYYNDSEYKGYLQLVGHEDIYFGPVNNLVKRIRIYQIEKQISLFNDEHRLLNEFSYPFLNVNLKRYSPESLNRIYMGSGVQTNPTMQMLSEIDSRQPVSIETLQSAQCRQIPSATVYGVLSNYNSTNNTGKQIVQLSSIQLPGSGYISINIPDSVHVDRNKDAITENSSIQTGSIRPVSEKVITYVTPSDKFPVRAKIHLTSTAGGLCTYEADSIMEILGF